MFRFTCALFLALASSAIAAPASAFSNQPDPTWMTNGFVRAVIRAGNRIYIGGRFTSVRGCAPGTSCPGSVVAVNNVAAFDAETGAAIPSFKPEVTGETGTTVYALAVLGGKLFIGGKFTSVDGQPRLNFAAVDAISGGVDAAVDAQIGSASGHYVRALLAAGDKVFVGGVFGSVDGVARARLAAFNVSGELDLRWRPRADAAVASLALACDGQTIFVGGNFRRAAGSGRSFVARETLARFDLAVGNIQDWQVQPGAIPNGLNAYDLAPGKPVPNTSTCERLFVAYAGSNWAYAVDTGDNLGEVLWALKTAGDVQTVAVQDMQTADVQDDRVLLGGHFSQIDATNQSNVKRTRFAVVDLDGRINPGLLFEGRFLGPWDILVDADRVWVGGDFLTVSGVAQRGIASFTNDD